jgi:hypothetical protein
MILVFQDTNGIVMCSFPLVGFYDAETDGQEDKKTKHAKKPHP